MKKKLKGKMKFQFQPRNFLLLALLSLSIQFGFAQSQTVRGRVVDETGEPAIGVNILQKGNSQNGTVTDSEGNFSLNLPPDAVLTVSYVGYATQEVNVENKTFLQITLKQDLRLLDEVVVTALNMSREKKSLGYALTEIKGDEIIRSSVTNPINALQGKVAGVQIDMGSGGPQASQRILIRGNTSMSGNNQPIFVVDGIIIDNDNTKTGGWADRDFGNDIKNLNANDFESVSILKGAAATALYGSRASNGVILITTKKGKKGDGLGVSFSHTQKWEKIYSFPDFQNEFGMGTYPLWPLNADGTENRNINTGRSFGPRFDYKPYSVAGIYEGTFQPYENNVLGMYQTGRYEDTNVAVSGGTETGSFRFSYSNLQQNGLSLNNKFDRNTFSMNATQDIGKYVTAKAGFNYVQSDGRNPTYQGDRRSPIYDFSYTVPREYDIDYWKQNYWNIKKDGFNPNDPWGFSQSLFEYLENNEIQNEENYRGYFGTTFKFTDWLSLTVNADMNRTYKTYEKKTLATENSDFRGAEYRLNESQKLQYKANAMLTASHRIEDFSLSGSIATERFHEDQSYNQSWTDGGLRVPGVFELNNSVNPARTNAFAHIRQKRINSVYGFINTDWKGQVYLDITGRNDWSSTLRYANGTGNVSYFYPSVSAAWLLTETFRGKLPSQISFAKVRASYAIVGKDCDPYLITDPGSYKFQDTFRDDKWGTGTFPYFVYANTNLGALDLKPERQHAVETGFDLRMFDNRLGIDFAYYKTNTKNQILSLATSSETGVANRVINAGNIQNAGVELLITGTLIKKRDFEWDLAFNYTLNRNKIIDLYPGVTRYRLLGGSDVDSWATAGGSYGDLYSSYAFKRDENGQKLLNGSGQWIRSGTSEKIGNFQPDFMGGLMTNLRWKDLSFGMVIDSRFGGQIWSGSYNYGMSSGKLKSSLTGRTQEYGGLARTLADGRTVYDGMIPDGVFDQGVRNGAGVDMSGMTYQEAYNKGLVDPVSASVYYDNLYNWGPGIREASIVDISWIALREISVGYNLPKKWTNGIFVKGASLDFIIRNVGYLYNSLPDNINPQGLKSNHSAEFTESGGSVYSREYGIKLNINF